MQTWSSGILLKSSCSEVRWAGFADWFIHLLHLGYQLFVKSLKLSSLKISDLEATPGLGAVVGSNSRFSRHSNTHLFNLTRY